MTIEQKVKDLLDGYSIETLSGRTDLEGIADIYRAFWDTMKEKLTPGIESFARETRKTAYLQGIRDAKGCVPEERLQGGRTYCAYCKQHIAAGDCDCGGRNACREETLEAITRLEETI